MSLEAVVMIIAVVWVVFAVMFTAEGIIERQRPDERGAVFILRALAAVPFGLIFAAWDAVCLGLYWLMLTPTERENYDP